MNDIKARIKSVSTTMQITKAMELVATSKLRRAKERAENSKPYRDALVNAIRNVRALPEAGESVFGEQRENPKVLMVVIAGDRGLAGGFNANVFRKADEMSAKYPKERLCYLPVGKKAIEHYKHKGSEIISEDYQYSADFGVGESFELGRYLTKLFLDGTVDRIELVFTKFVSMLSQVPNHMVLLPLAPSTVHKTEAEQEPIFECSPDEFLEKIVPEYLGGCLYIAFSESVASECGARRTAMNSANKNAQEMIDDLSLRYNRARQAVITQEITEIVSGAEAL